MKNTLPQRQELKQFFGILKYLQRMLKIKSHAALAELIGVPSSTVRAWFTKKTIPSMETINHVKMELRDYTDTLDNQSAIIKDATLRQF